MVGNLSPPFFEGVFTGGTNYCDPSNWTLVQEWDTNLGELSSIAATFSFDNMRGFAWNPSGSRLTISNPQDDVIRTFLCSTPFDPETASTLSTATVANPIGASWIRGGLGYVTDTSTDTYRRYAASNYSINSGAVVHSEVSKANLGFAGPQDGSFCMAPDGTYGYWHGEVSAGNARLKYVTFDSGDMSTYSVDSTSGDLTGTDLNQPGANQNLSTPNQDGDKFFFVQDGNAQLITMDSKGDLASLIIGAQTDLNTIIGAWSVQHVWIDPDDTYYVWLGGFSDNGIQLAKFKTNC